MSESSFRLVYHSNHDTYPTLFSSVLYPGIENAGALSSKDIANIATQ